MFIKKKSDRKKELEKKLWWNKAEVHANGMGKIRIFLWSILPQKELGAKNHKTDWITRIVIASGWFILLLMALLEICLHAHGFKH